MSPADIRKRIAEILEMRTPSGNFDSEAAHIAEDKLLAEVLAEIAKCRSITTAKTLAKEAIKVKNHDFPRWYS